MVQESGVVCPEKINLSVDAEEVDGGVRRIIKMRQSGIAARLKGSSEVTLKRFVINGGYMLLKMLGLFAGEAAVDWWLIVVAAVVGIGLGAGIFSLLTSKYLRRGSTVQRIRRIL